jgi:rhodanese-related sulfurtransferase
LAAAQASRFAASVMHGDDACMEPAMNNPSAAQSDLASPVILVPGARPFAQWALVKALRTGSAPTILDIRKPQAFAQSGLVLPGALRCAPDALAQLVDQFACHGPVVTLCVHGHEVSQGAAAFLVQSGYDARFLAGGFEGLRRAHPDLCTPQDCLGQESSQ